MGRDTKAGAKQEVYDLLAPAGVPAVAGIAYAYRCDPGPGRTGYPTALMVFSAGSRASMWLVAVRVAVSAEVDAEAAQNALDGLAHETDMLLTPHLGPGDWDDEYDDTLEAWTNTAVYGVPREDAMLRYGSQGGFG
jgi:hypothetical protein